MDLRLKLSTLLMVILSVLELNAQTWTFDCDSQGWGEFNHSIAFNMLYQPVNEDLNSGHIELTNKTGNSQSWLFGPLSEQINADQYKYLHFSLSLENVGNIPEEGMNALFVWDNTGDMSELRTKVFKIYSGQNDYTIDLSDEAEWKGMLYINRFHFPHGDQTDIGYTPESAVYRMDWISLSETSELSVPVQDTTYACLPEAPVFLTPLEAVVFCNRASFKTSYAGSRADATLKIWIDSEEPMVRTQVIYDEGIFYFSTYDLEVSTTYNYQIELTNSLGRAETAVQQFTTENKTAEEMPVNYWMTPSPFRLEENANEHLLDNDSWPDAGSLAQVYKIHGATYKSEIAPKFYSYDFPKLIYTINKYRMRLALEGIVQGDRTGQEYANDIFYKIEGIAAYGGKLEFFTWDGMMFRNFYASSTNTIFRTPEEGIEVVAEATKLVKDRYPYFELVPLPNLPNWNIKDAGGVMISHNAGDWAGTTGVESWDLLCDIYLQKIKEKGVSIHFIEIDHPYAYYIKDGGREMSARRIGAIKDYCIKNNLELSVIVNQSNLGGQGDFGFKQGCLDYLDALREDNINPAYIDVESWYEYPQYLVPETKENSFSNVIRDVGKSFFSGGQISISSEGDLTTIGGSGNSLQLYANWAEGGEVVEVSWTVDKPEVATIDENTGLLSSVSEGIVVVSAIAKDGSGETGSLVISINNSTFIYSYPDNDFRIYPNPVQQGASLHLEMSENLNIDKAHISVIDLQGRILHRQVWKGQRSIEIPVAEFSKGLYIVKFETTNNIKSMKFVIE